MDKIISRHLGYLKLSASANEIISQFVADEDIRYDLTLVLGDGRSLIATDGCKMVIFTVGADLGKRQAYILTSEGYLLPTENAARYPDYTALFTPEDKLEKQKLQIQYSFSFSSIVLGLSRAGFWVNEIMFDMLRTLQRKDIEGLEVFVSKERPETDSCLIKFSMFGSDVKVLIMPLSQ